MKGRLARVFKHVFGSLLALLPALAVAGAPAMKTQTASAQFDRLFVLAQSELEKDKVDAITDWSFNDQKPFPCVCFETGEKWHYVWTRDLSYAADLALARLDPERTKTSLRFKLSTVRNPALPQGLYVVQDTGSGGSWPISTDRVVWFLAARHLLDDPVFAEETWRALVDTLAQDRQYVFDSQLGLYRGETSFLDWREQSYPAWTATDTTWIGESFALSTNVLHYEALRLAEQMAHKKKDARASVFGKQAAALKSAIDRRFWNPSRGLYRSYIGPAYAPVPVDAYDLLGTSLAILADIPTAERAARVLAAYPVAPKGSPVIWPQRRGVPIYHNRAIWPFVSAYALRAARKTKDAARFAFEVESIMRGASMAGSNMENYELATQSVHVDAGALSGPVVNSPRQLWSVAGYLDMVLGSLFGLRADGRIDPMIPVSLVPMLFGEGDRIALQTPQRRYVLVRPRTLDDGGFLVPRSIAHEGRDEIVQLRSRPGNGRHLKQGGEAWAPTPLFEKNDKPGANATTLHDLKTGWTAPRSGRIRAFFRYRNANGPVNTGISAAVKTLVLECDGKRQTGTVVMPHREGEGDSTSALFDVRAGNKCMFALEEGFNMSDLDHFAHYTGGKGGASGPLNTADIGALTVVPLP